MVKRVGILLMGTLLSGSLCAESLSESQKIIGVEISASEVQGDGPSDITSNTSNGASFGLRLGAQNAEWRTLVGFTYFDKEGRNVEKLYGSIDYFFMKSEITDSLIFKPFLGINVGYANYESAFAVDEEIDEDGVVYGGQAGIVVDVLDYLSMDVSYKYSLSSSSAFDHSADVVFGFNYHY